MMLDLNFEDTRDCDYPAKLPEYLPYQDLVDSQDQCISVQYNEIDLGNTGYGFDQEFEGKEANLYFERMREFSEQTLNDIREDADYKLHFHRTNVSGNIKQSQAYKKSTSVLHSWKKRNDTYSFL